MKYILDFDLTLSDYHKFLEAAEPYKADGTWITPAIWDILDATEFLYEDAIPFLEKVGKENVHILTAMSPYTGPQAREFQKTKLQRCGIGQYVSGITFMEGDKGPYVKNLYDGTPTVFVDDNAGHLRSSREHVPEVHAVQMVRPETKTIPNEDGFSIVHSFDELHAVTQTL